MTIKSVVYLLVGIVAITTILVCFPSVDVDYDSGATIFYYAGTVVHRLALPVIPLLIVISLIEIRHTSRQTTDDRRLWPLFFTVFLLIGANIIACGASMIGIVATYTSVERVVLGNHIYRLDWLYSPGFTDVDTDRMLFWECDETGLFCRVIYTDRFIEQDLSHDQRGTSPMLEDFSPHLLVDNHHISVLLKNQLVYSHSIEVTPG